jgi:hypothetical protein
MGGAPHANREKRVDEILIRGEQSIAAAADRRLRRK